MERLPPPGYRVCAEPRCCTAHSGGWGVVTGGGFLVRFRVVPQFLVFVPFFFSAASGQVDGDVPGVVEMAGLGLGHIRTERRNRRRFRRYQRLTPVVALRIHRSEVRS